MRIKNYFTLTELVSQSVAKKYGDRAWSFFDPRLLDTLVWLREGIGLPMVINTSSQQQRGFRENTCPMVSEYTKSGKTYASAHMRGQAVDFSIAGGKMSAEEVRNWIRTHMHTAPWAIRIEKDVTWVHVDVCNISGKRLEEFKA